MNSDVGVPLRVAILTNIVPRYRTPVFLKIINDSRFQLRIFVSIAPEFSDSLARKVLDLHYSRTFNISLGTKVRSEEVLQKQRMPMPFGLPFDLIRYRPDIIISGDIGIRSLVALLVARLIRVPLLIWSEETLAHAAIVSGMQRRVRRFLLSYSDGFLAWGKSAFNYLVEQGVSEKRITYCAQAVDNDEWAAYAARGDVDALRQKLGIVGRICLAVGQLLPLKGYKEMLLAFGALPYHIKKSHSLVLVGDGPEKARLEALACELKIDNFFMVGKKPPEELAVYYRAADFMILPSFTDVWGLVVNEAMACGTPVISSIYAGATEELVLDTGIGEAFDPGDQRSFTDILARWLEGPLLVDSDAPQRAVSCMNFQITVEAITRVLQIYASRKNAVK